MLLFDLPQRREGHAVKHSEYLYKDFCGSWGYIAPEITRGA
jgi:hypothetical protein